MKNIAPLPMNRNNVLAVTSLLSIILLSFHFTDDIVYGTDRSPVSNVVAIAILVIWLYGTLVLGERRSGYAIMFLGSVAGIIVFTVHSPRARRDLRLLRDPLSARVLEFATFKRAEYQSN